MMLYDQAQEGRLSHRDDRIELKRQKRESEEDTRISWTRCERKKKV